MTEAPFVIGLTGGIASGKSTVAGHLAEAGFTVVDADQLIADLYRADQPGAEMVRELFGEAALSEGGAVDHGAVAEIVFSDPEALERLEAAVHPLVRAAFAEIARKSDTPAVLEATLLVEAGHAPDFDLVVTVEADAETRIARAVARGLTEAEARARLEAQADSELRRRAAHRVIENDGSLEDLSRASAALIEEVRSRRRSTEQEGSG